MTDKSSGLTSEMPTALTKAEENPNLQMQVVVVSQAVRIILVTALWK
jgi:hypothetical protein